MKKTTAIAVASESLNYLKSTVSSYTFRKVNVLIINKDKMINKNM